MNEQITKAFIMHGGEISEILTHPIFFSFIENATYSTVLVGFGVSKSVVGSD